MTNDRSDGFRYQELTDLYNNLKRQSILLFADRCDGLMQLYGDTLFDNCRECAEIIGAPTDRPGVTPTLYMAYREAKFVLGCDPSESAELDRLWARLYEHAKTDMGVEAATTAAALNTLARRDIMSCQRRVNTAFAVMSRLLDTGRRRQAQRIADDTLRHVRYTFRAIAASYTQFTLQSH